MIDKRSIVVKKKCFLNVSGYYLNNLSARIRKQNFNSIAYIRLLSFFTFNVVFLITFRTFQLSKHLVVVLFDTVRFFRRVDELSCGIRKFTTADDDYSTYRVPAFISAKPVNNRYKHVEHLGLLFVSRRE